MFGPPNPTPLNVAADCLTGVPAFQRKLALDLLALYPPGLQWEMVLFLGEAQGKDCLPGAIMVMWSVLRLEPVINNTIRITFPIGGRNG